MLLGTTQYQHNEERTGIEGNCAGGNVECPSSALVDDEESPGQQSIGQGALRKDRDEGSTRRRIHLGHLQLGLK